MTRYQFSQSWVSSTSIYGSGLNGTNFYENGLLGIHFNGKGNLGNNFHKKYDFSATSGLIETISENIVLGPRYLGIYKNTSNIFF